jgi:hypothetical protein
MSQKRFRLGALVPSDFLPQLLALAQSIPAFLPLFRDAVRIGVVLDAQKVQQELRWRLGRREKPYARTRLHEAIASGVVIPFTPTFLDREIEEHFIDISKATRVGIEDVQREWQDFRKLLHFYSPTQSAQLGSPRSGDSDDLPYIGVANEQAPVISILIDETAQAYARSSSVWIGVTMGSTFTVTLSFEAIAAAGRGLKSLAGWFRDLHPGMQLAIFSAGIAALAHPKSRATLASVWERTKQAAPTFLNTIADIASQIAEAKLTEADASRRLQDSLPIRRRRSALMHARVVCLAARTPLSLAEIEKRIRSDGYVSRARNLGMYLRRVLIFARLAAPSRRVSSHRNIRSFTPLIINATIPQHLPTALSFDCSPLPRRPNPTFAHMQFP